jgi:hypothetical protein
MCVAGSSARVHSYLVILSGALLILSEGLGAELVVGGHAALIGSEMGD